MNTKAGLSMTKITIIAVVGMVIATIVLFLLIPYLDEEFGTRACDDVSYTENVQPSGVKYWTDDANDNRKIIYYPKGIANNQGSFKWQFVDAGYNSYYDPANTKTLAMLITRVTSDHDKGLVSDGGYHWFKCVAGAID